MKKILTAVSCAMLALSFGACAKKQEAAAVPPTNAVSEATVSPSLQAADAFLAENGKKSGVMTTKTGLQYQITKAGDPKGKKPAFTSIVEVEYEGKLLDGSTFDKTEAGKPIQLPVQDVIPAWTEALLLMHVGDEVTIWAHPKLAYKDNAMPPGCGIQEPCVIPSNSLLVFKMKLIGVKGSL